MTTKTATADSGTTLTTHDNAVRREPSHWREGKDKLMLDLATVADDTQALLKETVHVTSDRVAGAPAYLEERLSAASDRLQRARRTAQRNAKRASAATEHYVRKNPWKSLGIAAIGGMFVSLAVIRACKPALRRMRGSRNERLDQ